MGRRKKVDLELQKKVILLGSVFFIVFLFLFLYYQKQQENYRNIKLDKNKHLVYTKYQSSNGDFHIQIPTVNIKGNAVQAINHEIDSFVASFPSHDKVIFSYDYDINGEILSLIIKVIDYDVENYLEPSFLSYHIRLDTLKTVSNDELFSYFTIDEDTIRLRLENQFHHYYDEIVEDGYYQMDECDYSCFLMYRGIDDYLDSVSYYVKDQKLYAYRPFIYSSVFGEEYFFKENDFAILVASLES